MPTGHEAANSRYADGGGRDRRPAVRAEERPLRPIRRHHQPRKLDDQQLDHLTWILLHVLASSLNGANDSGIEVVLWWLSSHE